MVCGLEVVQHRRKLLTLFLESEPVEITRDFGQNSIPALLREQTAASKPEDVNVIRQDMRSLLGLDNSAPFPLMSSRHLSKLTSDISSELPSDREVMKLVPPSCHVCQFAYMMTIGYFEPTRRFRNHSGVS